MRVPQTAGFDPGFELLPHQEVKFQPVAINTTGYMYVWVSNESEATKVWFDDLSIVHHQSIVTQATDYGVWGEVLGEQKTNVLDGYRYGYQGQFAEKDVETGWNHFELREYDPVIGRWLVPDPARQYFSPYVAFGNNPINKIDPDGGTDGEPSVGLDTNFDLIFAFDRAKLAAGVPVRGSTTLLQAFANWTSEFMFEFENIQESFTSGFNSFFSDAVNMTSNPQTYLDGAISIMMVDQSTRNERVIDGVTDYFTDIPNKSLSQMAFDVGYASGPVALSGALSGIASSLRGYSLSFSRYPRAGGFGLNLLQNERRIIGLDYHRFRIGGRKTGIDVTRPHIDMHGKGIKHWPWHQIDKWRRGAN